MDAVEYLKEKNRMCRKYGELPRDCFECPIGNDGGGCQAGVFEDQEVAEEELVAIVEKWSAEHPIKTRQSEFLKMFPNAQLDDDGMFNFSLNPCDIDPEYADKVCDQYSDCQDCQREYWSEEVE